MKKSKNILSLIFFLTFFFSVICISALEQHTLTNFYQKDYDMINRTVFVLSSRPDYLIEQRVSHKQIRLVLEGTAIRENLSHQQSFFSPVLESLTISPTQRGDLQITINTKKEYYLEYFELSGREFRIVLDIFNKETPETAHEKFAFGKFYQAVGHTGKAESLLTEVMSEAPQISGANYYLGKILLERGETAQASNRFADVEYTANEYVPAQIELMKLGQIDLQYSREMEQAFNDLRDYFLQAGDPNRQNLLLALAASIYGDANEVKTILDRLDYEDPALLEMINNIAAVYYSLTAEEDIPGLFTILQNHTPPREFRATDAVWILAIIIITAFIVYVITFNLWKSREKRRESFKDISFAPKADPEPEEKQPPKTSPAKKPEMRKKEKEKEPEQKKPEEEKPVEKKTFPEEEVKKEKPEKKSAAKVTGIQEETKLPSGKKAEEEPQEKEKPANKPQDSVDVKTKLALTLYHNGWNKEAIANELKIDIERVERIISLNEEK